MDKKYVLLGCYKFVKQQKTSFVSFCHVYHCSVFFFCICFFLICTRRIISAGIITKLIKLCCKSLTELLFAVCFLRINIVYLRTRFFLVAHNFSVVTKRINKLYYSLRNANSVIVSFDVKIIYFE